MFNVPTIFYRYSNLHGGMRAIVRGVGKAGDPVACKRRRWPALLAHVDRLRGTVARFEPEPYYIGDGYLRDVTLPRY